VQSNLNDAFTDGDFAPYKLASFEVVTGIVTSCTVIELLERYMCMLKPSAFQRCSFAAEEKIG
jgi:hypothetical protein